MTKDITLPPLRKTFIGIHFITFQRKREDALDSGWIPKEGNFDGIFPGKAIGGSVYYNRNGHLPSASGRVWYEADINYSGGFRGVERILYSNDGLIFVTYDHYESFAEVV